MIFTDEKWPVLGMIEKKMSFDKAFLSSKMRNDHNPFEDKESWEFMWTFWNRFIDYDIQHFYVSKKIHHLVDFDKKMYPILQEEVYKPEFHRPFHGTVNYSIQEENNKQINFTVLLEIPPKEEVDGRHVFSMAVFCGSPSIFLGMMLGEDYGDKCRCLKSIGDMKILKAMQDSYTFCKQFLYFIDHVEVQEKYTLNNEHRRVKTKTGQKYITYMPKIDVNVIDSTYYTRTISTGEFKVSGHWRLQPCGPRMAHRKLKWIDEFVKHGMTRKAKIEIE